MARQVQMTRHLVVCEGTMTEPLYFDGIKAALGEMNGRKVSIMVKGSGLHTLDLLEFAQETCRYAPEIFDHVWLAYDKDDFSAVDFDTTDQRCRDLSCTGTTTYHALWSNPCFEACLILHFGYTTAPLNTVECIRQIENRFSSVLGTPYGKNREDTFALIEPMRAAAIQNARKLNRHHEDMGNKRPSQQNPGTQMHQMIEELEAYL